MTRNLKPGIYRIRNVENGKCYIGSSVNVRTRLCRHRRDLDKNIHHAAYLQFSWNKYGAASFEFSIIEMVARIEDLVEREQFWINESGSYGAGYNMAPNAGSNRGIKQRPETKARISAALRGKSKPPISAEHRANLCAARIGIIQTPETRAKRSATMKLRGIVPQITKEQHERSNMSRRGAKRTPEQIERLRIGVQGAWDRKRAELKHLVQAPAP